MNKYLFNNYKIIFLNIVTLIISITSFYIFFKDTYNSNDLTIHVDAYREIITPNSFLFNFILVNKSDDYIEDINAIVDVYDENAKLISSGETPHDKIVNLIPLDGYKFKIKILINEDNKKIKYMMIIPYSKKGTGKISLLFID